MEDNNEKKIDLEGNEIMRVILEKIPADDGENYHFKLAACMSNKEEDVPMIREALVKLCQQTGVTFGVRICFPQSFDSEEKED